MPDDMNAKTAGRAILSIVAVLVVLFVISPNLVLDLIFFDRFGLTCDVHRLLRRSEKLPSVSIENGNIVYCRMHLCDFRFPLPNASHLVNVSPLTGGGDTIDGTIYVEATNGTPVDLDTYSDQIKNYHLEEGGWVVATRTSTNDNVAAIRFSYFGDY